MTDPATVRGATRVRDVALLEQDNERALKPQLARQRSAELAAEARRQRFEVIREQLVKTNGNVAMVSRELGVESDRVRHVPDMSGIPVHRGTGPRIDGPRGIEREAVLASLRRSGGNVKRAVRETGVPETTVYRWKQQWQAEETL